MNALVQAEGQFLLYIQENLRFNWLNPIFKFITFLGDLGWFWLLLTLIFLIVRKSRRTGMIMFASAGINIFLVNVILKNAFARTRPYIIFESLISLVGEESDFSFPSGHSAISFSVATVILLCLPKKFGIPAIVLAFLISVSRLYVGVHYPTDVICGILIGIFCAFVAKFVMEKLENKFPIIEKIQKL